MDETKTVFQAEPLKLTLNKYHLMVMDGVDKGKKLVVDRRSILIGSSPDNDFELNDPAVSRVHCKIELDPRGYRLIDLNSKNGIVFKGHRVGEIYLKNDTVFQLGEEEIVFQKTDETVDIAISQRDNFGDILGSSLAMKEIFAVLEKISPSDTTILVEGESGTGKELIAEAIHQNSKRRDQPLVVFDCSAVSRELIESELFGHVKGAFTGAIATRKGAFEQADNGTLFIDELGELNLELQPKLLRALEKREIKPVGANTPVKIDVRIIAATNRSLKREVEAGNFREDLYYRLNVIKLFLPPLRERREDIPQLVRYFLKRCDKGDLQISYETMEKLKNHSWPGNVRELKNFIERSVLLSAADQIETKFLDTTGITHKEVTGSQIADYVRESDIPFKEAKNRLVEDFERMYWANLLTQTAGNITKAAKKAEIHRKTAEYLVKKYNLKGE